MVVTNVWRSMCGYVLAIRTPAVSARRVHVQGRRSSGIFICYRRVMADGHAGRLKDRLVQRFPPPYRVFMDVDPIPAGTRWVEVTEDAIRSSGVVLVAPRA